LKKLSLKHYDAVVDTLAAKLEDELKDAIVAEHTQV
jgi:hypothetical protein